VSGNIAETALRYVISHPVSPVAIPGATRPDQAKANAEAGGAALDAALLKKLQQA
jgi:aryl-alcohol dehydrogenase-like predicted oxidoreductase